MWENGAQKDKKWAGTGLRRLLLDKDVIGLHESREHILHSFHSGFSDCVQEQICMLLSDLSGLAASMQDRFMWVGIPDHILGNNEYISSDLGLWPEIISSKITSEDFVPYICKSAQSISFDEYGGCKGTYAHHTLGDAISAVVEEESIYERSVTSVDDGEGMRKVRMLLEIIKRDKEFWLLQNK